MTTHDRFLELAAVEIDFPLVQNERAALERHLETCPACRAEAAALRSDARAIAELWQPRLDPVRADQLLGNVLVRKARRPALRYIAIAALLALLTLGALAVGAELLRETVRPPLVVVPAPSIAPPILPAGPWTVAMAADAASSIGGLPVAIAESGGRLVAVGRASCTTDSDTGDVRCTAHVRRSVDGLTWTAVTSPAFEFDEVFATSGPEIGMWDIAGRPDGFVAIGYDGPSPLRAAVWTSPEGELWERLELGAVFANARVNSVTVGGPGWVIVGSVHETDGPRGAAWTSPDGRTWTQVPDGPTFDVGGYLDTGEEPGSGSLRDVAATGDVVVAVGDTCDSQGGACRAATWRSSDAGATWARAIGPDVVGNLTQVILTQDGFMAFGVSCKVEAPCTAMLASSDDGTTWSWTPSVILPAESRILAAVAVDGGIVAGASQDNGLIVMGTRDGTTWDVLHQEALQPSADATPQPGFATLQALRAVRTSASRAVFVGYMEVQNEPEPWTPLVIHVDSRSP